jgi:hypothetical protein
MSVERSPALKGRISMSSILATLTRRVEERTRPNAGAAARASDAVSTRVPASARAAGSRSGSRAGARPGPTSTGLAAAVGAGPPARVVAEAAPARSTVTADRGRRARRVAVAGGGDGRVGIDRFRAAGQGQGLIIRGRRARRQRGGRGRGDAKAGDRQRALEKSAPHKPQIVPVVSVPQRTGKSMLTARARTGRSRGGIVKLLPGSFPGDYARTSDPVWARRSVVP